MYRGYYLNPEKSERRRALLSNHLAEAGVASRYERFPAVDGRAVAADYSTKLDPGNLGLWLTHEKLAEAHRGADGHLHVLEDDVVLARNAGEFLDGALRHADAEFPGWDLLFTDTYVPFDAFGVYAGLHDAHRQTGRHGYLDLTQFYLAGMSSFFINRSSLAKYLALIRGKWSLGTPIDMFVRQLIRRKQLKAYVTVPFMTTLSAESDNSSIRGSLDASHRVFDTFRRSFFQDADHAALLEEMLALTRDTRVSPLTGIYLNAFAFRYSDRWVSF